MTEKAKQKIRFASLGISASAVLSFVVWLIWQAFTVSTMACGNKADIKQLKPMVQQHEIDKSVMSAQMNIVLETVKRIEEKIDRQ